MATISRYVPELDGLRGIAILAVVVHHQLTPFSLSGGFLGVDLFFVLSGFLITGLLLDEYEKTRSISLRNFYMRRVLRLGPALALYLLASLTITYYTHLLTVTRQLKLIIIALLYSTNWRMAFGWDVSLDPTAITWSLSIEEQFYLVWPLIVIGCLALKLRRRFMIMGIGLSILAVMIHRYLMLDRQVNLARIYYGTDTKADALLVGCLIALLPLTILGGRTKKWLNVASILSAVALAYLAVTASFRDTLLYRGGFTGVALLSGILILVAANSPPRLLSIALRFGPLRWLGRISYGLYLWHWIVVRNTSFYYLGYWEPWARLALSLGIASASFYLIEKRFNRLKRRFGTRPSVVQTKSGSTQKEEAISPIEITSSHYKPTITST